jgi:hypothetical protein
LQACAELEPVSNIKGRADERKDDPRPSNMLEAVHGGTAVSLLSLAVVRSIAARSVPALRRMRSRGKSRR